MDKYLQKNGTLKNRLRLISQDDLSALESMITTSKEAELAQHPILGSFDFKHLQKIHKFLFGDIYEWAGKCRTTPLAKQVFDDDFDDIVEFCEPSLIESKATSLLKSFPNLDLLASFKTNEFAIVIAPFLVQLNNIHPFREGNGRTQRAFFKLLARHCGHDFAWDVVTRDRNIMVSVQGARGHVEPMQRLLLEISDLDQVRALRKGLDFLRSSGKVPWNDLYVSTTRRGQRYRGKLVGVAAPDFMMRVSDDKRDDWIAIGQKADLPENASSGDEIDIKPKFW